MQQPLVGGHRLRRGARAELLAQEPAQTVEHPQALGHVALSLERAHQQHVAGLAIGLGLDQTAGRPLHRGDLAAAELESRPADHLQGLQADLRQLAPPRLEPRRAHARQQPAARDVQRHLGQRPGGPRIPAIERLAGAPDLGAGGLEVDPRRLGQGQHQLVAAGEDLVAQARAQSREQRPQGAVLGAGGAFGPDRVEQLVASDRATAAEHQIGEQQGHLPAAQRPNQLDTVQLHRQPAAELDPRPLPRGALVWQRYGNVSPTGPCNLSRRGPPGGHKASRLTVTTKDR